MEYRPIPVSWLVALAVVGISCLAMAQDIQPTHEYPMTVASQTTVSVTTSGVIIQPLPERRRIRIYNLSSGTQYINLATTTFTNGIGIPLFASGSWKAPYAATIPVSIGCDSPATSTVVQEK